MLADTNAFRRWVLNPLSVRSSITSSAVVDRDGITLRIAKDEGPPERAVERFGQNADAIGRKSGM